MNATNDKQESKSCREPLFSRSRLVVIVAAVMVASFVLLRFVFGLSESDLKLPVAVVAISLATFVIGQFARHRLHKSWIAWAVVGVLAVGGYLAFQWHFGESLRETAVALLVNNRGGKAEYHGANFDSPDGYFESEGEWWLPVWVAEFTGKSYFADVTTIDLQGTQLGDDFIPLLADVRQLENLFLADSAVTANGVAQLPIIPGVRQIALDWRQVAPEAIARIKQFDKLNHLIIAYPEDYGTNPEFETRITDVAGLDQIRELSLIYDRALTEDDARTIASLINLQSLYIAPPDWGQPREIKPAGALMPLAEASNLQRMILGLNAQDVSLEELEAFAGMPWMSFINIVRHGEQPPFPFLPEEVQAIKKKFPGVQIRVVPLESYLPGDKE